MTNEQITEKIIDRLQEVPATQWQVTNDKTAYILMLHNVDFELAYMLSNNLRYLFLSHDLGRFLLLDDGSGPVADLFEVVRKQKGDIQPRTDKEILEYALQKITN